MQLKAYVQRQSIFPLIDSTYSAKAVNDTILNDILKGNGKRITAIIVSLPFVMIVIIIIFLIVVIPVCKHTHRWPKMLKKLATFNIYLKQKQAVIIGAAIISYLLIAYIIALDIATLVYRENPPNSIINKIHHRNGAGNPFTLLYEIPIIVIVLDFVLGVVLCCFLMMLVTSVLFCCDEYGDYSNPYFFLCLSIFGFVFCIITHLPFIAIAYLNDAYHAGSIFIYYIIVILILFAVVEQVLVFCLSTSKLKPSGEIQLQGSKWHFESGELHILAADVDQQEEVEHQSGTNNKLLAMKLSLDTKEDNDNRIKVSQGKVGVHFRSVDSEIVLQIKKGTFRFKGCKAVIEESKLDGKPKKTKAKCGICASEKEPKEHKKRLTTFLERLQSERERKIILRDSVLPTADVKNLIIKSDKKETETWLTFSGLKPVKGQELKLGDIDSTKKTVQIVETELTLQKVGKIRKLCCRKSCTTNCRILYKSFCCTMFGTNRVKNDCWSYFFVFIIGVLVLFIIGIVAVLTSYFVIIPINRSISDAPNRLVGIYESAIVLVGAYIAYKAFFKAKKYLESSVIKRENPLTRESKDKWKDMSDEEKLAEFYSAVVDIIADKKSKCQQQDTLQPNTNTVPVNGQPQGTPPRDEHIGKRSNAWPTAGTAPGGQPETGSTTSSAAGRKPTDSVYTQPATAICEKVPGIQPANVTGEAADQGEGQLGTGLTTSTAAGALDKHTEYSQPATAIGEAGKGQSAAATEGGQRDITQPGTAEQDENREVNATQESREDTPPLSSNSVAERTPLLNT